MDSERFDRLVRSFGQTRSRRQAMRGLTGAVAVGALALGGREASADLCKDDGKKCTKDGQCCSDNCVNPSGKPVSKSGGTCQNATPNVCSGKYSPSPCFELSADTCGTTPGGRSCRCGTDINGDLTCFENVYCLNPLRERLCETNADCVALNFPAGSVCFSAENCCSLDATGKARGCTTPCPTPSA